MTEHKLYIQVCVYVLFLFYVSEISTNDYVLIFIIIYKNLVIDIIYFVVQGEILKEDGEKNLGNHDSELAQSGPDSVSLPESVWENSEEVIPTFFSAMSARYSRPFKLPDNQILSSLLRNQL